MSVILEAKEVYRFFDVDGRQVPVLKSISFALDVTIMLLVQFQLLPLRF